MSRGIATPQHRGPRGNLWFLRLAVVALFAVLTIRLADMQLVQGDAFAQRAEENHIIRESILGERGLVYDRDGALLVRNIPTYSAAVTPAFMPDDRVDQDALIVALSERLGVPALDIGEAIRRQEEEAAWDPVSVKDHLTLDEAMIVEELSASFPAISLEMVPARLYLGGNTLSHIMGYIGPQSAEEAGTLASRGYALNEPVGKTGLELQYEAILRGVPGYSQNEVDAFGRLIEPLSTTEPHAGQSLRLSIDKDLQDYIAQLLLENLGDAPTASAVVMDPNTGEILALVSVPSYDNNIFTDISDPRNAALYEDLANNDYSYPLVNHAIADENVPGSVYKLITASAALQEGVITPATSVNVPQTVLLQEGEDGEAFPLVDWRAHGWVDLRGAISWSSNIYMMMATCGLLESNDPVLGANKLKTWAERFGLGKETGIDLPGEADGRVPSPEWKANYTRENFGVAEDWFYGDTCQMGIGQGYNTASPLQIARMTAAVANGGTLVTPRVVDAIIDANGMERELETERREVPVAPEHLQVVREGMLLSVNEGAASNAYRPGLAIAGKTGTAEFREVAPGVFDNHAWFTSFAPYNSPEVVVTVYFELGWGGDKAAPVAGEIMEYYFENVAE